MVTVTAEFVGLHDVAQVLAEHISDQTDIVDVQVGMPRGLNATTEPAVRITLLNATALPSLHNEPPEPRSDTRPSPLLLSCLYLISTSGAEQGDPGAAHTALGHVLHVIHQTPVLLLPWPVRGTPPSALPTGGKGQLRLTPVTFPIEQLTQVWRALQQPLQPGAVLEAGPIRLTHAQ